MGFSARIANGFVANLSPLIDVLANSLSVTFNDLAINQLPWPRPKRRGFFYGKQGGVEHAHTVPGYKLGLRR
jgi:hypothetical protein